ncbi:HAD family hydrolase [Exiguobacterium antarcticum]|uniref:HAD family phosphatase n=1 Tax=Exiguobacterium antarcticum TaxID=132920 RepID=A0ABT6QXM1_9BACL|nr:HAD family phosphatase [Exiguobacterium antarcticum]AFS71225.1 HAD-superfamily hydrolase, subfamily IA, variant 3 [Exiguobacterium antarcticum B7]MDI3233437.1 HAD family phosphatase [Exiguobacterium antarcticum]
MKKNGLIFDMDGVILDSEIQYFKVHQQMFETLSIPLDRVQYATFMGKTGDEMWQELITQHDLPHSTESLLALEHELFQQHAKPEECGLKDGVHELMALARTEGYKVAIASSSSLEKIKRVITHYGLTVDAYASGFEVPRSKPDPAIFQLAAKRIGQTPEACIVIEDSANGMIGAKEAGMEVIALLDERMPAQALHHADHVVSSHEAIGEILRNR